MRRSFLLFLIGLVFLGATFVEVAFLSVRLRPAHAVRTTIVPAEELLSPASTGTPAPAIAVIPGRTIQHRTVQGEWLIQIARCYGVNLQDLRDSNPQVSDPGQALEAGMLITVPRIGSTGKVYGPPCVLFYTVQNGDTWASIAQRYAANITVLMAVNPGGLSPGTLIRIPLNSGPDAEVCQPVSIPAGSSQLTESGIAGNSTFTGNINLPCFAFGSSNGPAVRVSLRSSDQAARLAIVGPGGTVLKPGDNTELSWTGSAPDLLGANIHIFSALLNTVVRYTLEVTALSSAADTPTPVSTATPEPTPPAPGATVVIRAEWPPKLEVDQPGTLRISIGSDHSSLPTITGNQSRDATPRPVGTAGVDINEAFGPDYEVFLVPTLLSANMTREPTQVRPMQFDESLIYWEWSISWSSAGSKKINVSMEIERRRKDGTGQPDPRYLWRPLLPLDVEVNEPWFSIKDLRLSALLSGFVGSGLTFQFLYGLYKDRSKKARSRRKPKPPRS